MNGDKPLHLIRQTVDWLASLVSGAKEFMRELESDLEELDQRVEAMDAQLAVLNHQLDMLSAGQDPAGPATPQDERPTLPSHLRIWGGKPIGPA